MGKIRYITWQGMKHDFQIWPVLRFLDLDILQFQDFSQE